MDKKILLLTASPANLAHLQTVLRQRPQWQIHQASSLKAALKTMVNHPPDLLILDMEDLPPTQTQNFLRLSSEKFPQTARILLLKQGSEAMLVQSLSHAHQAMQKPFQGKELIRQIQAILTLKDLLANSALQNLINRIGTLPSPPTSYITLINALEDPDVSTKRIGQIISQDAAMSLKVLQLVNSPFFGLARQITSPEQAIHFLGLEIIRALSLTIHIFEAFKGKKGHLTFINALFDHGLQVATLAKAMGEQEGLDKATVSQIFLTALTHDIGKLILISSLPQYHGQVQPTAIRQGIPLHQAETRILGCSHAEIGAYLLALWGIPEPIILHVANSHLPEFLENSISVPGLTYFANILTNQQAPQGQELCGEKKIFPALASDRELKDKIAVWQRITAENVQT